MQINALAKGWLFFHQNFPEQFSIFLVLRDVSLLGPKSLKLKFLTSTNSKGGFFVTLGPVFR